MVKAERIFKSLEELVEALELEESYGNAGRFKIRFVSVPDFASLKKLRNLFVKRKFEIDNLVNMVDLKGIAWLSVQDIKDAVNKIGKGFNGKIALLGVGEIVRFFTNEELTEVISGLINSSESFNSKVIIPLAGLSERISDFVDTYHRRGEHYLFYKLLGEGRSVNLYVINPECSFELKNPIKKLRDFILIPNQESKNIYVDIKSIYRRAENAKPDTAVQVIKIENEKDILNHIIKFKDEIVFGDREFITHLLEFLKQKHCTSFEDILALSGRSKPSSFDDFLEKFAQEKDRFFKSIYLNYASNLWKEYKNLLDEDVYVLAENIWNSKLKYDIKRLFLSKMINADPSIDSALCKRVVSYIDKDNIVGILSCEKEKAIGLFADRIISENELTELWQDMKKYLSSPSPSNLSSKNSWILDYIHEYKLCKLKDKISEKLNNMIAYYNSEDKFLKWYYEIPSLIEAAKGSQIIQIDAMGMEWLGFVVELLKERGISIKDIKVARANLPTTTEFNKLEGIIYTNVFDDLVHKDYKFPSSIVKQVETLSNIISRLDLSGSNIVITSDHGSTAFSRLLPAVKSECPDSKFRYCKGEWDISGSIKHKNEHGIFSVMLNHTPINSKPRGEVHGGATPEEVLIPVVFIGAEDTKYSVVLDKDRYMPLRDKVIKFKIVPDPRSTVYVQIKGIVSRSLTPEGEWYVLELPEGLKAGTYDMEIYVGAKRVVKRVEFKSGMSIQDDDLI